MSGPIQNDATEAKRHSCALCHKRKVKCNKQSPCGYCVSRGVACVPMAASGPRKRRFPEAELIARLKRYEKVLEACGIDVDSINSKGDFQVGNQTVDLGAIRHDRVRRASGDAGSQQNLNDVEGTERLLISGLNENSPPRPIFTTYDNSFELYGSPLVFNTGPVNLVAMHPSLAQILKLWQTFLDNVHPLLKIIHAPSVQEEIFKSITNLSCLTPPTHAVLFSIYAIAVLSMPKTACSECFGEDSRGVLDRFHTATRVALRESGFLKASDQRVLAATTMCLISMTKTVDPRLLLSMTAATERNARRNGYHLNAKRQETSLFEGEMRRRIWWQLVVFQSHTAEAAAAGPSALSWDWQTNFPLHVNETDLASEMESIPIEHTSMPTDFTFCAVRYEIAGFLHEIWTKVQKCNPGFSGSEFSNACMSLEEKLESIRSFEHALKVKYFDKCDETVALHVMARHYATHSMSKMRLSAYVAAMREEGNDTATIEDRRDALMTACLEAIESYNSCSTNKGIAKFNWFLESTIPFLAYAHLLFHLRFRPLGQLADRAWAALTAENDPWGFGKWNWGLNSNSSQEPEDSAMQLAFARLTIKAWEKREAAFKFKDQETMEEVPSFVARMQEKLLGFQARSDNPFKGHDVGEVEPPALALPAQLWPTEDLLTDHDLAFPDFWSWQSIDHGAL